MPGAESLDEFNFEQTKLGASAPHSKTKYSSGPRLEKWQRATAWPVIILSFAYIAAYVVPIYFYPLEAWLSSTLAVIEYSIWALFILDYFTQLYLSADRRGFLRHEWLTLVVVIIPFFRPVRAIRGLLFIRQAGTRKKNLLRSLPPIMVSMALLLILIAGAAVLNAERFAPDATIRTPSDALWWALTTLTTSGAGNLTPVTNEGRLIAAFLLIFGLGLLASMTGYVASWVLHQFNIMRDEELEQGREGNS